MPTHSSNKNLDITGKTYVKKGCIINYPGAEFTAKVKTVRQGVVYLDLPIARHTSYKRCNQVLVVA